MSDGIPRALELLELAVGTLKSAAERISHLKTELAAAQREIGEMKRERDLAIAHDRQPYPTSHAYEQVCKADEAKKIEIEELKDLANGLIAFAKEMLPICPEKARRMIEYATEKGREMRSNATAEIERLKADLDAATAGLDRMKEILAGVNCERDELREALEKVVDWAICDRDKHGRSGMAGGYAIAQAALNRAKEEDGNG